MKTIVFTPRATKELDALPAAARAAIESGLHRFAIEDLGDVKKLQGLDGYRLRVGEYRVIFDQDKTNILAISVGRRQTNTYAGGRI